MEGKWTCLSFSCLVLLTCAPVDANACLEVLSLQQRGQKLPVHQVLAVEDALGDVVLQEF